MALTETIMQRKIETLFVTFFFTALLLITASNGVFATESLKFEVISSGHISGYIEETYLLVKTENDWIEVWETHSAPYSPVPPCPEVDFSHNMIVCAFMGVCPTSGYSITISNMWVDGETLTVEIVKGAPLENCTVAQVLTYPYILAFTEKNDLNVVYQITDANGSRYVYPLPDFPNFVTIILWFFMTLLIVVTFTIKQSAEKHTTHCN